MHLPHNFLLLITYLSKNIIIFLFFFFNCFLLLNFLIFPFIINFFTYLNLNLLFLYFNLESLMVLFSLLLIMVAICAKNKFKLLSSFLDFSIFFYLFLMVVLFYIIWHNIIADHTMYYLYNTLKVNQFILVIKLFLCCSAIFCFLNSKRYLLLMKLNHFEYPILINFSILGIFIAISANNWIILFLALELQALIFLILFSFNKLKISSLENSLKFIIINFIASILLLLSFIEIMLYTQTVSIALANPLILMKTFLNSVHSVDTSFSGSTSIFFNNWMISQNLLLLKYYYNFDYNLLNIFTLDLNYFLLNSKIFFENPIYFFFKFLNLNLFGYDSLWFLVSILTIVAFAIKLGLLPFGGLWLPSLYNSIELPVLLFFSTIPKILYIVLLFNLYINVYFFFDNFIFLFTLFFLSISSIILSNVMMFLVKNNILILLAWSSMANIGLLCFLFSNYPFGLYFFVYLAFYILGTIFFFLLLQYLIIKDNFNNLFLIRSVKYFTDLSLIKYQFSYKILLMLLMLSLLNFMGIPPLLGFWMKFYIIEGLLLPNSHSVGALTFITIILFITLIGSFSYLKLFYALISENVALKFSLAYWPKTKNNVLILVFFFFLMHLILIFLNKTFFMFNFLFYLIIC